MIGNITTLSIDGTSILTDGKAIDSYVGADLSYGFKPSRAGWDKVGSYVNFGIESLVLTFALENDFTKLDKEAIHTIVVGNAVETITFTAKINNTAYITYPDDVKVGVQYPQMKSYFRIDLMPTNSTEFVEAKAA